MTESRCFSLVAVLVATATVGARVPDSGRTEALARRVADRVAVLQREADRLARQARTLLGDVRRLEIERDMAVARLSAAEAAAGDAAADVEIVTERLAAVEQERVNALPDLKGRFVELYKHRRGGYARMLLGVRDMREFGRATRALASLAHLNQQRIDRHRRTLAELREERARADEKRRDLRNKQALARKARITAERAVQARATMVDEIDRRRDLTAQLAGELQVAQHQLEAAVKNIGSGLPVDHVSVPLAPFRGALDWPVIGQVVGRFGGTNRMTLAGVRNGIEVAAPAGTPVYAVHPGTVGFADAFGGYGTLVILDHGANHYTLYGYLSERSVEQGQHVAAGDELGRVGSAPAGDSALYYEMRVDGRSVDPLQWLKRGRPQAQRLRPQD